MSDLKTGENSKYKELKSSDKLFIRKEFIAYVYGAYIPGNKIIFLDGPHLNTLTLLMKTFEQFPSKKLRNEDVYIVEFHQETFDDQIKKMEKIATRYDISGVNHILGDVWNFLAGQSLFNLSDEKQEKKTAITTGSFKNSIIWLDFLCGSISPDNLKTLSDIVDYQCCNTLFITLSMRKGNGTTATQMFNRVNTAVCRGKKFGLHARFPYKRYGKGSSMDLFVYARNPPSEALFRPQKLISVDYDKKLAVVQFYGGQEEQREYSISHPAVQILLKKEKKQKQLKKNRVEDKKNKRRLRTFI